MKKISQNSCLCCFCSMAFSLLQIGFGKSFWRYLIDNTESVESVLSWLSNLNLFYYAVLLPLIGAVIVLYKYSDARFFTALSSFDSRGSVLLPIQKLFLTDFFTQETRFIIQSLPRFIMLGIFMSCYSFLWEECCWQSNTVKNVKLRL